MEGNEDLGEVKEEIWRKMVKPREMEEDVWIQLFLQLFFIQNCEVAVFDLDLK
jgi:hypothetical protein